jgi:endonuclease/exonuclease/phosphatase family metal-dependent hydrolase
VVTTGVCTYRRWGAALAVLVVLMGCVEDDVAAGEPGAAATFETYNTGLAPGFVPHADARLERAAEVVARSPADVFCLQEVFVVPDEQGARATTQIDVFEQATSEAFPHTFAEASEQRGAGDESATGLLFGGHDGLMLLSRHAFVDTDRIDLESTIIQRSAVRAQVAVPGLGEVDVYCTHLTAAPDIPYDGDTYSSFTEENAAQIDALLEWVERTSTTGNVVLLGDFNTGPAVGGLDAELPDNYRKFEEAGLVSAYVDSPDPQCTSCAANTLKRDRVADAMGFALWLLAALALTLSVRRERIEWLQKQWVMLAVAFTGLGIVWFAPFFELTPISLLVVAALALVARLAAALGGLHRWDAGVESASKLSRVNAVVAAAVMVALATIATSETNIAIDHVFLGFESPVEVTGVERTYDETQPIDVDGDAVDLHLSDHYGVRVTVE